MANQERIQLAMLRPIYAVLEREIIRMMRQRTRLVASMVRPLIWLLIIGTGFGSVVEATDGFDYQSFLVPGIIGMTILFGAMLAALTTVYDRESGVMRMMIIAPLPSYWIVFAKMLSASLAAIIQALLLIAILSVLGFMHANANIPLLVFGLIATAVSCSGLGILTAAFSRTLDNFAAIMNFVIFPVFFLSGAMYPLNKLPELLKWISSVNPFTYGVDLLKHAIYPKTSIVPDFSILTNVTILTSFILIALTIASWRFSREEAQEPLVHILTKK